MKILILILSLISVISAQPTKTTIEDGTANSDALIWDGSKWINISKSAMQDTLNISGITLRSYGLIGDNSTDDLVLFRQAITDTKNSSEKTLILYADTFYVSDYLNFTGLNVYGNSAYIRSGFVGTEGAIRDSATITSYENADTVTVDAYKGQSIITITNASFISGLRKGDVIKIISDKVVSAGLKQGELCLVQSIADTKIYLQNYLNDTYLALDNPRIQIFTKTMGNIYDLILETPYSDNAQGIVFTGIYKPNLINVTVINAKYAGVVFYSCYAPKFNGTTMRSDQTGTGYGVYIGGNMFADIQTQSFYCRHAVTTGGVSYGLEWNALVHDSYGINALDFGIFDTHAPTGSATFENCTAKGGMLPSDSTSYQGGWAVGTTYDSLDIVARGTWYYKSAISNNIGNDPLTETNFVNWTYYRNNMTGFTNRAPNVRYINCEAIDVDIMFKQGEGTYNHIEIINMKGTNCSMGILLEGTTNNYIKIDNVHIQNDYPTINYLLHIDSDLKNVEISNLTGNNMPLLLIHTPSSDVDNITIKNIRGGYDREWTPSKFIQMDNVWANLNVLMFDGLRITPQSTGSQICEFKNTVSDTISTHIIFKDVVIDSLVDTFVEADDFLMFLKVHDLTIRSNTSSSYPFNLLQGVGTFILDGLVKLDDSVGVVNVPAAKIFDRAYINGYDKKGTSPYIDKLPTLEVLQGSMLYPNIIRGSGDPNGTITGNIGEMYLNRTYSSGVDSLVYYNTTGSTIWKGK